MNKYTWDMSKEDPMILVIKHNDKEVMRIFLGEAMETAGRMRVMRHVKECDRTLWLSRWHDDPFEILKNSA